MAPSHRFAGGRRWWAHLRWTRRNIEPTFPNKDIEEHPEIWDESDFLACLRFATLHVMVAAVASGPRMIQQFPYGLSAGGRGGERV
jgi:hypothetical protein